jgi:four helix bundle protein
LAKIARYCSSYLSKFRDNKDFGFKNQICRAVVSISNNIAEGFERKGQKEFKQYLHIALGSSSEVKSMVYLAEKLNYITKEEQRVLFAKSEEVGRLIFGLIRSIKV